MRLSIATLLILSITLMDGTLTGVSAQKGEGGEGAGGGAEATTQAVPGTGNNKTRKQCLDECKGKPDAEGGKFCGEFITPTGGKINGVFRNQCELDCRKNFKKSKDNSCMKGHPKGKKPGNRATTQKPK